MDDTVFKGRHFDRTVILLCIRWDLAYGLSLRNLEEMMAERGITVDHATVGRWVVRYSPESLERLNCLKRPVTRKWHADFIPTVISVVTTSDIRRRSTLPR
jgi:transposase-like protein